MDDNAWPHRILVVQELLESEDITRMDWPAYFPDLNPIEHLWDALGRRFATRLHHPENTQQLKQMLVKVWALLLQEMLHQLALSMWRRCEATIADGCTFGQPVQAYDRECLLPTVKFGSGSVMICPAMSWFSAKPIVTIKGRITGKKYREILAEIRSIL
ncbi:transposable element Tc1 transposase [Trichonephila clavipes]|nr:transposable element Tc1 transposase [Trichonephila clavipes]